LTNREIISIFYFFVAFCNNATLLLTVQSIKEYTYNQCHEKENFFINYYLYYSILEYYNVYTEIPIYYIQ